MHLALTGYSTTLLDLYQERKMQNHTKPRHTTLAMALAAIFGGLAALPAQAFLIYDTYEMRAFFSGSASVTDRQGGDATTRTNVELGSSTISQFDPSMGVLMGTTLRLRSSHIQTVTVTAQAGQGNNNVRTTSGTGTSRVQVAAPGIGTTFATLTTTASCTGTRAAGCTGINTGGQDINVGLIAATGSLDSYVGSSTVLVTRTAPTLSARQNDNNFPGLESTTNRLTWIGSVWAVYNYLLHADASFDGGGMLTLDLDFGNVYQNPGVTTLPFSIFNAAGERVGLDLDGIVGSGDTSKLYTDLAPFTGLAAGSSLVFSAYLDTTALGNYSATYKLTLSDADVGARTSRYKYADYLILNLKGSVIERPQLVPEPGVLGLLGLGLLGLALTQRRR